MPPRHLSRTHEDFRSRYETDELTSAIGNIAVSFSRLEDQICGAIHSVLRLGERPGHAITAELSFKQRLSLLSSLLQEVVWSHEGKIHPLEVFSDVRQQCLEAEEIRNRVLHSSWVWDFVDSTMKRRKVSARAKHGVVITEEPLDVGFLADMADFIRMAEFDLVEFLHCYRPAAIPQEPDEED